MCRVITWLSTMQGVDALPSVCHVSCHCHAKRHHEEPSSVLRAWFSRDGKQVWGAGRCFKAGRLSRVGNCHVGEPEEGARLREVCSELLGPLRGGHGSWAPEELGLQKRALLQEVLREAARHRTHQSLVAEFAEQLSAAQEQ